MHITESMGAGVLKYLTEITSNLAGYDHSVIYSCGIDTPENIESIFRPEVRLINCQMVKGLNWKKDLRSLREIRSILNEVNPDIVHLHSSKAGFLGRLLVFLYPRIRFFYTPHCYSFLMSDKSKKRQLLYWFAELLLSQSRSKIVACSRSEYRYARQLSWFRKPILVENAMRDHGKYTAPHSYTNTIIGVGRLVEQKNPLLFIELVARIREEHPEVKAVWIGDGPMRRRCEAYNIRLNAQVTFAGALPFEKVIEECLQAAVFLQTSKWEGLPFTIIEAFSCGLPVVASDIESHRDLISHSENGYLAGCEQDYIRSLSEVLTNTQQRERISARARESYLSRHTIEMFLANMNEVYRWRAVQ